MVNGSLPNFLSSFVIKNKKFRFIATLKANTYKYDIQTERDSNHVLMESQRKVCELKLLFLKVTGDSFSVS